jgi:hypothetical protein
MQQMMSHIWRCWSKDFLSSCSNPNGLGKKPVYRIVVLLKNGEHHPLQWQLGVTEQTFAGDAGLIQVVTV